MLKTFFINSTLADYQDSEFSWLQSLLMDEGVFGDSAGTLGLQVTQNSPTGMSALISAGNALVELTKNGTTWKVVVISNAQASVTVPANASGVNRVDAVILRVDKDAEPNALKNNIATIELVQGTGTSALTDGAIDTAVGSDGWIRLADITVANGASSIVTGNIADKRAQVKTNDSFRPATKKLAFITLAADPSGADLVEGLLWYNSTTHELKYYDGTVVQILTVITAAVMPSGAISMFGGSSVPAGWLLCDGGAVSRSTYANLYSAIGTTYGTGDGSTTFNVPNLKGKVPVGYNSGETEFNALGKTGGEKTHVLTTAEMPSHTHTSVSGATLNGITGGGTGLTPGNNGTSGTLSTGSAGSDTAHNNLQPYIALNFIIKT